MVRLIKINIFLIFKKDHWAIINPLTVNKCLRAGTSAWLSGLVEGEHIDTITTEHFVVSAVFERVFMAVLVWRLLVHNCFFSRDHLTISHLEMRNITSSHLVIFLRGLVSWMCHALALLNFLRLLIDRHLDNSSLGLIHSLFNKSVFIFDLLVLCFLQSSTLLLGLHKFSLGSQDLLVPVEYLMLRHILPLQIRSRPRDFRRTGSFFEVRILEPV